jgi:hypothetical protein
MRNIGASPDQTAFGVNPDQEHRGKSVEILCFKPEFLNQPAFSSELAVISDFLQVLHAGSSSVLSALENPAMLRYHCLVVPVKARLITIMAPAESFPVCGLLRSTG